MEGLWKALRGSKQEALAPILVRHGVRSVSGIGQHASELIEAGIQSWQIEAVLAAETKRVDLVVEQPRRDLPVPVSGKRASLAAALEAAQPNQRQKSLEALDQRRLSSFHCTIGRGTASHLFGGVQGLGSGSLATLC